MQSMWILIAMPLAGLLCAVIVVARDGGMRAPSQGGLVAKNHLPSIQEVRSPRRPRRKISWISGEEFEELVQKSEDVILIDLGSLTLGDPNEFNCSGTLLIEPRDMPDVLFWSPPSSQIVVYGPRRTCTSVLPMISKVPGTAPVYLLSQGPRSVRGS
jgi:hypothetical protein